ncbi:MAG: hypothetical protein DMD96_34695 [Candidatus Rokuibacteriota bacterium]|nr:MAG: hypothetical protein DMD96_34695 [Candidatus Rokubacteria bacterium]
MMRLRRVSLLLALSLLTSAAKAHGECAWVLWEQTTTGPAPVVWKILRVSADMTSCEAIKARTVEVAAASPPTGYARERRGDSTVMETPRVGLLIGAPSTALQYVCLPDTVDPRGVKR